MEGQPYNPAYHTPIENYPTDHSGTRGRPRRGRGGHSDSYPATRGRGVHRGEGGRGRGGRGGPH